MASTLASRRWRTRVLSTPPARRRSGPQVDGVQKDTVPYRGAIAPRSSSADASVRSRFATPPEPLSTGAPKTTTSTSEEGSSSLVRALPKTFASQFGQQLFAARSSVRKASSRAARSVEDGATTSLKARISSCSFCSGDAALLTGLNSDCGCGADSTLITFSAVVRTSRRAFFCGCSDALRRRQCVPGLSPSQSSKPARPSRYFLSLLSVLNGWSKAAWYCAGRSERRSAFSRSTSSPRRWTCRRPAAANS